MPQRRRDSLEYLEACYSSMEYVLYLVLYYLLWWNLLMYLLNFIFLVANPIIQSYFRPEIKSVLASRCPLFFYCACS